MPAKPIKVCLELTEALDAYSFGERWNGFECPYFTREQANRVLGAFNASGIVTVYSLETDAFYTWYQSDSETPPEALKQLENEELWERWDRQNIPTDSGTLAAWPIGAFSYTWMKAQ